MGGVFAHRRLGLRWRSLFARRFRDACPAHLCSRSIPMIASDGLLRARELEAYESIASLDQYADTIRLILVEASMLSERYRYVQRHDVPHVRELTGLID